MSQETSNKFVDSGRKLWYVVVHSGDMLFLLAGMIFDELVESGGDLISVKVQWMTMKDLGEMETLNDALLRSRKPNEKLQAVINEANLA